MLSQGTGLVFNLDLPFSRQRRLPRSHQQLKVAVGQHIMYPLQCHLLRIPTPTGAGRAARSTVPQVEWGHLHRETQRAWEPTTRAPRDCNAAGANARRLAVQRRLHYTVASNVLYCTSQRQESRQSKHSHTQVAPTTLRLFL